MRNLTIRSGIDQSREGLSIALCFMILFFAALGTRPAAAITPDPEAPANPPMPLAAGEVDLTLDGFTSDGIVEYTDFASSAITLQPDGKIIAAGYHWYGGKVRVMRFHPDGTRDYSFGSAGSLTLDQQGVVSKILVQDDGRIVLAGASDTTGNYNFAVWRVHSNGVVDTGFGLGGLVLVDFDGGPDSAKDAALQDDGKIVVAGIAEYGGDDDFGLLRLNPNGDFDTSFGGDGKVTTGFGVDDDWVYALVLQPNGKIVVAGTIMDENLVGFNERDFGLARYNTDGSLDSSFGGDGRVSTGMGGDYDIIYDIALQPDGKIVAFGYQGDLPYKPALARYTATGSLDNTFAGDGTTGIDFTTSAGWGSVLVQPDGRIVASGPQIYRFTPSGSLDPTLDGDGTIEQQDGYPLFVSLVRQPDGKFLVTGAIVPGAEDFTAGIMRLTPDGRPDTSGKVITDYGNTIDEAYGVIVQDDGKILLAGESQDHDVFGNQVALARYNENGTPDNSFGEQGVTLAGLAGDDAGRALALTDDGKIVVAGFRQDADVDFAIWRLKADGSPDGSFNLLGFGIADFGYGDDYGQAVLVQADGKYVVAGFADDANDRSFAVARFNTDGSLDESFSGDGLQMTSFGAGSLSARAAVLQTDGKIVVVGDYNGDFAAVRYKTNGTLDPDFDQDGKVVSDLGGNDAARAVTVLSNGLIAIAGYSDAAYVVPGDNPPGVVAAAGDFALIFLNEDGTRCECGLLGSKLVIGFGGDDIPYALQAQPDGRLIVAGGRRAADLGTSQFHVARIKYQFFPTPGYVLDSSFGTDGQISTPVENWAVARSITMDSNYRLLIAGYSHNGNDQDFALVRYDSGMTPPPPPRYQGFLPLIER